MPSSYSERNAALPRRSKETLTVSRAKEEAIKALEAKKHRRFSSSHALGRAIEKQTGHALPKNVLRDALSGLVRENRVNVSDGVQLI